MGGRYTGSKRKLDNLCLVIDDNKSIADIINIYDIKNKLISFGFNVFEVNGHDVEKLEQILKETKSLKEKPVVIIANTKRGYGSDTLMNEKEWFHKSPNEEELAILIKEVENFA